MAYEMMIRADARSIGMTTATRVGGTRKFPRTRASEVDSTCTVYHADGSTTVFVPTRKSATRSRKLTRSDIDRINKLQAHRIMSYDSRFEPIGNID